MDQSVPPYWVGCPTYHISLTWTIFFNYSVRDYCAGICGHRSIIRNVKSPYFQKMLLMWPAATATHSSSTRYHSPPGNSQAAPQLWAPFTSTVCCPPPSGFLHQALLADPGAWHHEYDWGKPSAKLPGTVEDLSSAQGSFWTIILSQTWSTWVDLLDELEIIKTRLIDDNTYGRICQYMIQCVFYTFIFDQTYYISDVWTCTLHLMMSFSCAPLTPSRVLRPVSQTWRRSVTAYQCYPSGRSRAHSGRL